MSVESDLTAWLKAQPALTALISDRVYPLRLPDDVVLPAVTYRLVSSVPEGGLSEDAIDQDRFQLDCWAESFLTCIEIAGEVHTAFAYTRPPGGIDRILPNGRTDFYEEASLLYRRSLDFLIFAP